MSVQSEESERQQQEQEEQYEQDDDVPGNARASVRFITGTVPCHCHGERICTKLRVCADDSTQATKNT